MKRTGSLSGKPNAYILHLSIREKLSFIAKSSKTEMRHAYNFFSSWLLVNCVEERPWWPTQSPKNGIKKKVNGYEEREGDRIKFIYLRFERRKVLRFRKARRRQNVP